MNLRHHEVVPVAQRPNVTELALMVRRRPTPRVNDDEDRSCESTAKHPGMVWESRCRNLVRH